MDLHKMQVINVTQCFLVNLRESNADLRIIHTENCYPLHIKLQL